MDMPSSAKEELRQSPHFQRALSPDVGEAVAAAVSDWIDEHRPRVVVGFLAMPGEIDIVPLVTRHPDIEFALTRTAPGRSLTLHPFHAERETHPFGFEQPAPGAVTIPPGDVDVVLVPGVAFTRAGARLGRGAGYYDRFLPTLEADIVGLTVEDRILESIPVEAHDVLMDWIATERGVRRALR
jgi:5-formyltetrahydrofolate cyclo-ligase